MTQQVPAWFAPMYNDKVIHKFQSEGFRLKGTTSEATEIKANECFWRIADAVEAILYKRGNRAVPAGGGRSKISAVMDTYQVYDEVYDDDLEKMPINEMDVVTSSGAKALGRKFDAQIAEAVDAAGIAPVVSDTTNGLTLGSALLLCDAAQDQTDGLWDGNWFCPLPSRLWNQLLGYKQFNSGEYTGPDLAFTKVTDRRTWNGVHWFMMPKSWFKDGAAGVKQVRMWHKSAVGYASNYAIKNNIAWDNAATAFTANMRMGGKAKVLLNEGVVIGEFKLPTSLEPVAAGS